MRKPILRMLTSIDGFIADPGGDLRFGSHWSDEIHGSTSIPSTPGRPRLRSNRLREVRAVPGSGCRDRKARRRRNSDRRRNQARNQGSRAAEVHRLEHAEGHHRNTTVLRGAELVEQVATLKGRWRRSAPHVRPSFARDPLSRGARGRVQRRSIKRTRTLRAVGT
jgi:hypothetical protein